MEEDGIRIQVLFNFKKVVTAYCIGYTVSYALLYFHGKFVNEQKLRYHRQLFFLKEMKFGIAIDADLFYIM